MKRHLLKHQRAILDGARHLGRPLAITVSIEVGSRHPHLVLEGHGRQRVQTIVSTPSSAEHAIRMSLCNVRRIMRDMATGAGTR